jgi:hypothetical protein
LRGGCSMLIFFHLVVSQLQDTADPIGSQALAPRPAN